MEAVSTQSHGAWSFKIGPTCMTYEGDFIIGRQDDEEGKRLKHGRGVMTWQDGRVYRGQFAFDKMNGEGVMDWPTGAKYVGQYCDNRKGGIGKLTLPDGSSFEGNWYKGRRHGEILYIDPVGKAFRMEYDSDQVVKTESIPSFDGWTLRPGYDIFVKSDALAELEDKEANCSEPNCCICLGELLNGETCCRTSCNHLFHKECIDNWSMRKNHCPLCLQKIPLHKVYEI